MEDRKEMKQSYLKVKILKKIRAGVITKNQIEKTQVLIGNRKAGEKGSKKKKKKGKIGKEKVYGSIRDVLGERHSEKGTD